MLKERLTLAAQNEMILVNVIEELVRQTIDQIISSMDMCTCDICKLNACAIALNSLSPHYVTTTKGQLLAKIPAEMLNYHTQVLVESTKALMKVKELPLH